MDGAVVGSSGVLPRSIVVRVGVHERWNRYYSGGETGRVDVAAGHGADQPLFSIDRSWTFSGELY